MQLFINPFPLVTCLLCGPKERRTCNISAKTTGGHAITITIALDRPASAGRHLENLLHLAEENDIEHNVCSM